MRKMLFVLMLVLVSCIALADNEVKTITYSGGFVASADAGTPYSKTFNFVSPDGVSSLLYAKGIIRLDTTTTNTRVYAQVDGEFCSPEYYDIPSVVKGYEIIFDCTDASHGQGEYTAGFQSTEDLENVYAEWEFTYLNDPDIDVDRVYENVRGEVDIFGTEYVAGDKGSIWLQLRDEDGAINNGNCYMDIYYPNIVNATHSQWLDDAPMLYLAGSDGIYYYDFTAPDYTGVYLMSAYCSYVYDWEWYYQGVSQQPTREEVQGDWTGSTLVVNSFNDFEYTRCAGSGGAVKYCEAIYNWTVDDTNMTSLDYFWMGESDTDVTIDVYVYNFGNSSWVHAGTGYTTGTGYNYPIGIDDFMSFSVSNISSIVSANDTVTIRVVASAGKTFFLFNNWLNLRASQQGEFITDLRGSGEIHVSEALTSIANVSYVSSVGDANSSFYDLRYAGGTEYSSGETAHIMVQFLRTQAGVPQPQNDGECNITVWYPDKSMYLNYTGMTYLAGSNGLYYITFTAPAMEGVYETDVHCYKGGTNSYTASTFHVSPAMNTIYEINQSVYNVPANVWSYPNRNLTYYQDTNNYTWFNSQFAYLQMSMANNFSYSNQLMLNINGSIFGKLTDIENELGEVNVKLGEIQLNLTELDVLVRAVNGTVMTKLYGIQDEIALLNSTVMNELYYIEGLFSSIDFNTTELENMILSVNGTVVGINNSIMNKLYMIQDDLVSLNYTVLAVNGSVITEIQGLNLTCPDCPDLNTTELENLIISVDNRIVGVNGTIMTKLYSLQDDIGEINVSVNDIKFNLTELDALVRLVNSTIVQEIQSLNLTCPDCPDLNTTALESLMLSVNNTVIDSRDILVNLVNGVNVTIDTHLDVIEQKIDNLTFLVGNLNVTIGSLSFNVTIPDLMNLTNSSIEAVGDELIIKMLEHARILNDRVVNFHNHNYCKDNMTMVSNVTYEYCIGGNCKLLSDIMDVPCEYGCDPNSNQCIPSPDVRWAYVGGFVVLIALLIVLFRRYV